MTKFRSGDSPITADLYWQCLPICVAHRRHALKTIGRHRLNQLAQRYRDGGWMLKADR